MRTGPGLHGEAATDDRQSITGNPQSAIRNRRTARTARKPARFGQSPRDPAQDVTTRRRATRGGYAL
ncbi:conserved hypothetical protein [Burkholderia pseudomallei 1106b]|uniref:Uncharacterized protein n=2 Tax=Burkholderia pseudomallei TaxID=28450 RepID=A0AAX0U0U5_BURPE|nr:conserved hypothetical protein [Burkholderia pseudomallei 1106a]AYX04325.1 hypothetical protein EGY14_11255 [Burkholderia pseudomallei]EES21561.1 conserved hypothetical protein [Burkholderia pseudomallei 1106b]MUU85267.1 hypothetical protein [Burkholderia pseudomallei]PJO62044.1 hypothetical protein CWD88_33455 [Burkholderia pseudomallei]